eukprot:Hpha_TRINITY_DN26354_c0_g1::TRINITY_DN26354_c0_g1_i1::g.9347::m.9347
MPSLQALLLLASTAHVGASTTSDSKICPQGMPADWLPACLSAELLYAPASGRSDGGVLVPAYGNGYVATFVDSDTVFAGGLFNGDATGQYGAASHRATIPSYLVKVVDGSGGGAAPVLVGQALDIRRAVFLRRSVTSDKQVQIDERLFAPLGWPNLLVHEVELTPLGGRGLLASNVSFSGSVSHPRSVDLNMTSVAGGGVLERSGTTLRGELGNLTSLTVLCTEADAPIVHANANEGVQKFSFLTVVVTSLNSTDPRKDARAVYTAAQEDAESLFASHAAEWHQRAEGGSIQIGWEGTGSDAALFLAGALNASLYAIRSAIRPDWPYGLSPGGLASNAYNGHTFWDQETWMWPPLLMLDPTCARSALDYRWQRHEQAHVKASRCGTPNHASSGSPNRGPLPGLPADALMFPWESALTGAEVQNSGGKIGPWGEYEQHVSGDVALAARQYWYASGDNEWLAAVGLPLVRGIADFYARRVQAGAGGRYEYNSVMGPDEYNWPVNNSAYTNAVARVTLEFATEAAAALGVAPDPLWAEVAAGLSIPFSADVPGRSDLTGGYHPEYDGFVPKKTILKPHPVKQADTIMLSYPIGLGTGGDAAPFRNDLSVYDPLTDPNGPAMTWSVFSIGWMNVKNFSKAAELFQRGYVNNVNPPFNVWSEGPHGANTINFITGAGGFLQAALFGATGMRIAAAGELSFDPPPPSVTGVADVVSVGTSSMHFCGWRLAQRVTQQAMEFRVVEARAGKDLQLKLANGTEVQFKTAGDAVTVPRGPASLKC